MNCMKDELNIYIVDEHDELDFTSRNLAVQWVFDIDNIAIAFYFMKYLTFFSGSDTHWQSVDNNY